MSDAELLEQTAEWLSRLAETIERVTERLADSIAKLQAEQERQAHATGALTARHEETRGALATALRRLDALDHHGTAL